MTPPDLSDQEHPPFVLHDHRKPRPHVDLRLAEGGVLRSWALPRGLPTEPGRNRLAVAVPDHAMDHLGYTDDDKSIADTGWWEEVDRNERRLVFTLHGRGVPRRYALVRTSRDWLLLLTKDQPAPAGPGDRGIGGQECDGAGGASSISNSSSSG